MKNIFLFLIIALLLQPTHLVESKPHPVLKPQSFESFEAMAEGAFVTIHGGIKDTKYKLMSSGFLVKNTDTFGLCTVYAVTTFHSTGVKIVHIPHPTANQIDVYVKPKKFDALSRTKKYNARLAGYSRKFDLSVLEVEKLTCDNVPATVTLSNRRELPKNGDTVWYSGANYGRLDHFFLGKARVTKLSPSFTGTFGISIPVAPGQSGSPVYAYNGFDYEVVGIAVQYVKMCCTGNIISPAWVVRDILERVNPSYVWL